MDLASRLLYRDALMLVIDKPAGIAVHAGPKGGECLEDHFDGLRFGYKERPKLAHRLDRDTSGCLVLGRNDRGIKRLGRLFEAGQIAKNYWAIVHGTMPQAEGLIDAPLRKKNRDRRSWWMEVGDGGQPSRTGYRVLGTDGVRSFVEFIPLTGRTHQIRIHSAHLGCPLVGDGIYGQSGAEPLMLHSRSVRVPIVYEAPPVVVLAEPPEAMARRIADLSHEAIGKTPPIAMMDGNTENRT